MVFCGFDFHSDVRASQDWTQVQQVMENAVGDDMRRKRKDRDEGFGTKWSTIRSLCKIIAAQKYEKARAACVDMN